MTRKRANMWHGVPCYCELRQKILERGGKWRGTRCACEGGDPQVRARCGRGLARPTCLRLSWFARRGVARMIATAASALRSFSLHTRDEPRSRTSTVSHARMMIAVARAATASRPPPPLARARAGITRTSGAARRRACCCCAARSRRAARTSTSRAAARARSSSSQRRHDDAV